MSNYAPTRQELLILKNKEKVASRSKKLLEDKRNSLIKMFLSIIEDAVKNRKDFEVNYTKAYNMMKVSKSMSDDDYYDLLPQFSNSVLDLESSRFRQMNVDMVNIEVKLLEFNTNYSKIATNSLLDESVKHLKASIEPLIKTIELEGRARSLSEEIIKTRRRVNALEYVIIPEMKTSIKDIEFKLAELAQSMNVMLMRLKSKMA